MHQSSFIASAIFPSSTQGILFKQKPTELAQMHVELSVFPLQVLTFQSEDPALWKFAALMTSPLKD